MHALPTYARTPHIPSTPSAPHAGVRMPPFKQPSPSDTPTPTTSHAHTGTHPHGPHLHPHESSPIGVNVRNHGSAWKPQHCMVRVPHPTVVSMWRQHAVCPSTTAILHVACWHSMTHPMRRHLLQHTTACLAPISPPQNITALKYRPCITQQTTKV
jgi:hypothetical protein